MSGNMSMKELALLAGVSQSTASKALSGNYAVKDSTRQRVISLAERIGYAPNPAAQSLVTRRTNVIGLCHIGGQIPGVTTLQIISGAEEVLAEAHYQLMVSLRADETNSSVPKMLQARYVDGVIMTHGANERIFDFLKRTGVPRVLVNGPLSTDTDCVITNNEGGIRSAVKYLVKLGHKRIGFVGDLGNTHCSDTERAAGYAKAMAQFALPALPGYDQCGPIEESVERLLNLADRPTALICYNDHAAILAGNYLRGHGVSVPDQISIIGCDGFGQAMDHFAIPLSTLVVPFKEMGKKAAQMLLTRIEQPESPFRHEVLAQELLVRGTTVPPSSAR